MAAGTPNSAAWSGTHRAAAQEGGEIEGLQVAAVLPPDRPQGTRGKGGRRRMGGSTSLWVWGVCPRCTVTPPPWFSGGGSQPTHQRGLSRCLEIVGFLIVPNVRGGLWSGRRSGHRSVGPAVRPATTPSDRSPAGRGRGRGVDAVTEGVRLLFQTRGGGVRSGPTQRGSGVKPPPRGWFRSDPQTLPPSPT